MNYLPSMQTLRAFAAAYRLQNYSRAGAELGLTHGAISHRIRELEARLGAELFVRKGAKMQPTVAARQLFAKIGPALRILEGAFETKARGHQRPPLRVTVLPGFAARWLVSRLEDFHTANPGIILKVTTDVNLVELGDRTADAAVRYGPGSWPGVESEKLAGEVLFPVCSPAYRQSLGLTKPADLSRCVLLQHSWQHWDVWLEAAGIELENVIEGPTYAESDLLLKAAEAGQGVALARGLLAGDELRSGRLVRLFEAEAQDAYSYYLAWPQNSRRQPEIRKFGDWLHASLAAPGVVDGDHPDSSQTSDQRVPATA